MACSSPALTLFLLYCHLHNLSTSTSMAIATRTLFPSASHLVYIPFAIPRHRLDDDGSQVVASHHLSVSIMLLYIYVLAYLSKIRLHVLDYLPLITFLVPRNACTTFSRTILAKYPDSRREPSQRSVSFMHIVVPLRCSAFGLLPCVDDEKLRFVLTGCP